MILTHLRLLPANVKLVIFELLKTLHARAIFLLFSFHSVDHSLQVFKADHWIKEERTIPKLIACEKALPKLIGLSSIGPNLSSSPEFD